MQFFSIASCASDWGLQRFPFENHHKIQQNENALIMSLIKYVLEAFHHFHLSLDQFLKIWWSRAKSQWQHLRISRRTRGSPNEKISVVRNSRHECGQTTNCNLFGWLDFQPKIKIGWQFECCDVFLFFFQKYSLSTNGQAGKFESSDQISIGLRVGLWL